MSFVPSDRPRHVVPRWRPSISRATTEELASTASNPSQSREPGRIGERERSFMDTPNSWTAADLLSSVVSDAASGTNGASATSAAQLLKSDPGNLSPAVRRILDVFDGAEAGQAEDEGAPPITSTGLHVRISLLRESLRIHPRSSLRWLDLALSHLTLGNVEAGRKAVRTALSLSPTNRTVLRSSARFFVHSGEPDEALHWLTSSGRVETDPWILSAHISVSQVFDQPLRNIRTARSLASDESVSPRSTSELSATIASEELRSGHPRPARNFMLHALRSPTENAVAQAVWSRDHGLVNVEIDSDVVARSFEAETLTSMQAGAWNEARASVVKWLADEPFSVRASLHASYIASTGLEDYRQSLEFARLGLRTSPRHQMLLNNAAFALANLGETAEASLLLDQAVRSNGLGINPMLVATRGLVHFRQDQIGQGRELYRSATAQFRKDGALGLAALCQVMWAREEMRANTEVGSNILDGAADLVRLGNERDARLWLERIQKELKRAAPTA